MEKIKILHILPDFSLAGAEVMATLLMCNYNKQYQAVCISMYSKNTCLTEKLKKKGIRIYYLNKKKGIDFTIIWKLFWIIRKEKPNIIHTHLYSLIYSLLLSVCCGIKGKVHTIHNQAEHEITPIGQKIYYIAFKWFGVIPVAISPLVKTSIFKRYGINAPIVYNGVDIKSITSKYVYKKSEVIKFVHVGRFSYVKNHALLLDAFYSLYLKYPQIELHLLGTGELFDTFKGQVEKKNLQQVVTLYGLREDVSSLLSKFDVFVYPSRWEGLPMSIIEAMAAGLPIIASKVGGIPDIVEDKKNGYLVESENEKELIDCMEKLIINRDLIAEFGEKSIQLSKNYDVHLMVKSYEKIYVDLLDSRLLKIFN